ncbi:MAG TPA: hypothetical protein VFR85_08960 [Anaeromyxobacteraceae bacterium]|nr:hypothetical protein [Anaeromyxobacteraceae bacterium]
MIPLDLERAVQAGDAFGYDPRQFWAGYEILRGARAAIEALPEGRRGEALLFARDLSARAAALCREALADERDPERRTIAGAVLRATVMAWHAVLVAPPPEFEHGSDEERRADLARLPELATLFG